ncbi:MAG: YqcC family protein [Bacteroidota bacterium]
MDTYDHHTLATTKANEIEAELKRLNRWSGPLPPEKFEDMGAFGSNTMAFEQWLQFILLPRIHQIVEEKGEFPEGSALATYAIRAFDGDPEAGQLQDLLYELDNLINEKDVPDEQLPQVENTPLPPESVAYGDTEIPPVIFTLAELLPQFEGDDLESQLQTYDTFLGVLSSSVRPVISKLLLEAAHKTSNETSKVRILEAARSVTEGGRAAAPYNHEEAMKKYREEHKKSFPPK